MAGVVPTFVGGDANSNTLLDAGTLPATGNRPFGTIVAVVMTLLLAGTAMVVVRRRLMRP